MNLKKKWKSNEALSKVAENWELCADVEYSWGTSLHDGDMEEFLRIKTPQWRRGVLEKQASLMENMGSYSKSRESGEIKTLATSVLHL